jgi:hypothetical protein
MNGVYFVMGKLTEKDKKHVSATEDKELGNSERVLIQNLLAGVERTIDALSEVSPLLSQDAQLSPELENVFPVQEMAKISALIDRQSLITLHLKFNSESHQLRMELAFDPEVPIH